MLIRLGHSPDPDDAFMFWALAERRVDDEWPAAVVVADSEAVGRRVQRTRRDWDSAEGGAPC